jgi:hypothetical protein
MICRIVKILRNLDTFFRSRVVTILFFFDILVAPIAEELTYLTLLAAFAGIFWMPLWKKRSARLGKLQLTNVVFWSPVTQDKNR